MSAPTSGARGPTRAAFAFIFITVLLDTLALGLWLPWVSRDSPSSRPPPSSGAQGL